MGLSLTSRLRGTRMPGFFQCTLHMALTEMLSYVDLLSRTELSLSRLRKDYVLVGVTAPATRKTRPQK
jgi:hypothetical protein